MGVREIERFLEQWQMEVEDSRRPMIPAPTPRERERWYAILLLAQEWTSSAKAQALERDPHTIGPLLQAQEGVGLRGGRARCLGLQVDRGAPPLGETQQAELRAAVQELPTTVGIGLANWNWKVVRQFVSERCGISLCRSCCLNYPHFHGGRLCPATARTSTRTRRYGAG